MSFLWTAASSSFPSLEVVGHTDCCCCVFSSANIAYHVPWMSFLDQKRRVSFSCVYFSLCLLSFHLHPSTIPPPVRPAACFFLMLMQPENTVAFNFVLVFGLDLQKSCFHLSSSYLLTKLFWDISRDKCHVHVFQNSKALAMQGMPAQNKTTEAVTLTSCFLIWTQPCFVLSKCTGKNTPEYGHRHAAQQVIFVFTKKKNNKLLV